MKASRAAHASSAPEGVHPHPLLYHLMYTFGDRGALKALRPAMQKCVSVTLDVSQTLMLFLYLCTVLSVIVSSSSGGSSRSARAEQQALMACGC